MSKKNLSWLGKKFGLKVTDGIIKNKCSVVKSNEMAGVSKRRANSCFATEITEFIEKKLKGLCGFCG
jgi:hypothetical protein